MRISVSVTSAVLLLLVVVHCTQQSVVVQAFVVPRQLYVPNKTSRFRLQVQDEKVESLSSSPSSSIATASSTITKEIGLLTFDLDDTLYPIAPVVRDANGA
jgi:hypothetical protein